MCFAPCYTTPTLIINPELLSKPTVTSARGLKHFRLDSVDTPHHLYHQKIYACLDQFVTSSRCSAVAVKATHYIFRTNGTSTAEQDCAVYVPTGVKVADLVEVVDKFISQVKLDGVQPGLSVILGQLGWIGGSDAAWIHTTKF